MIIGRFKPSADGGWSGIIRTLTINAKVRFVPNDNRENDRAPEFRIFIGTSEIGAAWLKRVTGECAEEYLSVSLDGPGFAEPISAALLYASVDDEAELIWRRVRSHSRIGAENVPNC